VSTTARARCAQVRLYLIMDAVTRTSPERFLAAAIAGGVDMVQLREKTLGDGALLLYAQRCARVCQQHGVPFIVNDRVDIALAAGADGVHVGQDDIPFGHAKLMLGPGSIVGISTHDARQIDAAHDADYLGVGPIFETPTKPGRPAVGTDLVRYAAANARAPFFPIGGLDPSNVGDVICAGAHGVSVYRWIARADDPARAAREMIAAIDAASLRARTGAV
jgi:thiamine-phosphate pyrophosphorylase